MNKITGRNPKVAGRASGLAALSLALGLTLHLGGCALGDPAPQPETPPTPVTAYMRDAGTGEATTLDDPDFGKGVRVTVDEVFTSAKGEECKRGTVLSGQREAEVVVICRNHKGRWEMVPRVWGQGISN